MNTKRIYLSSPTMHEEEHNFIREAFDKNWVAPLGFNCDGFEQEMIGYMCTESDSPYHALALSSGTAAIHLAVKLAGIKPGDIVFCSDMTFAASVNPVIYEGGIPVFIDSEEETWNMDPKALEKAFAKYPDTKAVILVHLYGTPAKMDEIVSICKKYGAVLIEDAAEALSATYKGKPCGTFGQYGALSFNGNKIITTSGGGMLLTATKEDREKALFWSTQSREKEIWYEHEEIGYNYRMSNIVAGIGRGQMLHLEEHRSKKESIYRRYKDAFVGSPLRMNPCEEESRPNYWLSCISFDENCDVDCMEVIHAMNKENIESRPFWKPMHMQPVFEKNDFITVADQPIDEKLFKKGICLPSDIKMTEDEQNRVINLIKKILNRGIR